MQRFAHYLSLNSWILENQAINTALKSFAVRLVECWGHSFSASHWEVAISWDYLFPGLLLLIFE